MPFWDSRDEFGDTPLVVTKPEEGRPLARALGEQWMVLLRRHGATLAGRSLHECVFRLDLHLPQRRAAEPRHGNGIHQQRLSAGEAELQLAQPDAAQPSGAPGSTGPIGCRAEAATAHCTTKTPAARKPVKTAAGRGKATARPAKAARERRKPQSQAGSEAVEPFAVRRIGSRVAARRNDPHRPSGLRIIALET